MPLWKTKDQLRGRERYFIENTVCVNKQIPTRTYKEYYETNKNEKTEYRKLYFKNIKQQYLEKINNNI